MGSLQTYGGARSGVGRQLPVVLLLLVTTPVAPTASAPIAIVDVRLLPMDGRDARDRHSVLIEGERITWVGPADALPAEGVGLLIGSDAGIDVVDPGVSLLDELEEFVAAGIPPIDVLRIATSGAAEFLGRQGEFGVVASGARADLLLLDGDPSRDIPALRTLAGVMVRGRWFREPEAAPSRALPGEGVSPPGVAPPVRASAGVEASSR